MTQNQGNIGLAQLHPFASKIMVSANLASLFAEETTEKDAMAGSRRKNIQKTERWRTER